MEQLKEQCTLNDWCRKNKLEWSKSKNGIYLVLDYTEENGEILNAILIDKVVIVHRCKKHYCT